MHHMSKKAKHGHASSTWEWQKDDGSWEPYAAPVQAKISQAIARGEDSIVEGTYMLSFDATTRTGTQINVNTGWMRAMRSVPSGSATKTGGAASAGGAATKSGGAASAGGAATKSGGSATKSSGAAAAGGSATKTGGSSAWEWQDDDRSWKSFDDATQAQLVKQAQLAKQPGVQFGNYNIDTRTFLQTNLNSGFTRYIRHCLAFARVDVIGWATEIGWARVRPGVKAPKCGRAYDPDSTSAGDWEPLGDGNDDEPVVELPCSTGTIPCFYRKAFISQWFEHKPECPNCKHLYSTRGVQPSGFMDVFSRRPQWIEIQVYFPGGVQGPRQPSPGANYTGTARHLYYPNTPKGHEGVALIKKAFLQGVLFVVGTSVTTGASNTVIFGGIHLKTATTGGPTNHGYPDNGWLVRLKSECMTNGIS